MAGTTIPGYNPGSSSGGDLGTMVGGFVAPVLKSSSGTQYLGGAETVPAHNEFDTTPSGGRIAVQTPGYVKGDQIKLLPHNTEDLITLQKALVQAGYVSDTDAQRMVLGSPDQITTGAFSKLLATANFMGSDWRSALGSRLALAAQAPPQQQLQKIPPLTISVTNPDDIKAVAQNAAKTLNGTYMDDGQLNSFIQAYQAQERAYQTQQYQQQYSVMGNDANGRPVGTYGPGGEATAPATGAGLEQELEAQIRQAQPNEVASNAFTAHLNTLLGAATQNASAPILR